MGVRHWVWTTLQGIVPNLLNESIIIELRPV